MDTAVGPDFQEDYEGTNPCGYPNLLFGSWHLRAIEAM